MYVSVLIYYTLLLEHYFLVMNYFILKQNVFLDFLRLSIVVLINLLALSFFSFSIFLEREKTPAEIEELEKKQREVRKQVEEWKQSLQQEPPLMEITLSNNEKIIGRFEETKEYFENIKTESRYYKRFIVKIEKIK